MKAVERTTRQTIEVPTLLVAGAIHGGWIALTLFHAVLPVWAVAGLGGWLIAWHGSLQHETIHGHPTPWPRANALIGGVPLSLWLPYAVYRRTHLAHHRTEAITDPIEDPESRYIGGGARLNVMLLGRLEASLLGRLVLGPPIAVMRFLGAEMARAVSAPRRVAQDWSPHLIGIAALLLWLDVCGFALGEYLVLCVYPGTALTLLRSFAEHRAAPHRDHRVAIVESRGPLALLYLNNNLHAAHHRAPGLAWYRLPAFHARHRETLIKANGGLLYAGYAAVAARFLFRRHDVLVHPEHAG